MAGMKISTCERPGAKSNLNISDEEFRPLFEATKYRAGPTYETFNIIEANNLLVHVSLE